MTARELPDYLPPDWPEHATIPTREEFEKALEEERAFEEVLKAEPRPMRGPPSVVDSLIADIDSEPGEPLVPEKPSDSFTDDLNSR